MTHIAFTNVQKRYGKTDVVRGLDFSIRQGEFVVILGPSGCGKSTLLRMLAGLEEISGGEVTIDGAVVNEREPRERGCAMVFQNYALYPHMTVADNIGYALRVAGMPSRERRPRIEAVARTVGLGDFLDRKPAQLSGGQRQRVAMARAMIREPKIFLFDEPLSNLDAKLRVQMRIEIRKLHNRLGVTSIFVTHDQIEAMTLADRLVVMNGGRIEQAGAPHEVYRRPASLFVAGFVGSPPMNLLPMTYAGRGMATCDGQVLNIPEIDVAHGQHLTIGVRPEDIAIGGAQDGNGIELDIDFVEELGASRLLHGRFQSVDFAVQVPALSGLSTGRLNISLPVSTMHVFDTATGKRLDAATSARAIDSIAAE